MRLRLALLCAAVVIAGCSKDEQKTAVEAASKASLPPEVRLATAESRPIERSTMVTGSLAPDESVDLGFEVPGKLQAVHTDFGRNVRKGVVLAELDRSELQLQLDRSKAALAQALARIGLSPEEENANPDSTPAIKQAAAQYEDALSKYENARKLVESGDIARERFTELEKQYRAREAALNATKDELRTQLAAIQGIRAELNLARKRLADATLHAPFDGAVTARLASPGQYLKENTPVVTIVKPWPLRLRVEVPESAVTGVRQGTTLTFTTDAAPGAEFQAVVRELNATLDAQSRSLTAEARLTRADPRLKPGMFVQVRLITDSDAPTTMVPREAIYTVAGLSKLFVVRDGRAFEQKVQPGMSSGGWVEVPGAAVRPGDKVALGNLQNLIDGAAVTVR
jgi:RND family efflux transporter MFP subunit